MMLTNKPEKSQSTRSVVIDFLLLLRPAPLLETLIVFRGAKRQILIDQISVKSVQIEWSGNEFDWMFDLRDPEIERFLSKDFDASSLRIHDDENILLALKIFRHAIEQGFIQVVDTSEYASSDTWKMVSNSNYPKATPTMLYPNRGSHKDTLKIAPDWPRSGALDLALALARNCQLVTGDSSVEMAKEDPLVRTGLLSKVDDRVLRESLNNWRPDSLNEILSAVDSATLLPHIVEGVIAAEDDKQYRKDLLLYLPKWIADTLTGGIVSHIEMLARIYNKKFVKKA